MRPPGFDRWRSFVGSPHGAVLIAVGLLAIGVHGWIGARQFAGDARPQPSPDTEPWTKQPADQRQEKREHHQHQTQQAPAETEAARSDTLASRFGGRYGPTAQHVPQNLLQAGRSSRVIVAPAKHVIRRRRETAAPSRGPGPRTLGRTVRRSRPRYCCRGPGRPACARRQACRRGRSGRRRARARRFTKRRTALRACRSVQPPAGRVVGAEIAHLRFVAGLALAGRPPRGATVRAAQYDAAHWAASSPGSAAASTASCAGGKVSLIRSTGICKR
jgi:hypothetical protein